MTKKKKCVERKKKESKRESVNPISSIRNLLDEEHHIPVKTN